MENKGLLKIKLFDNHNIHFDGNDFLYCFKDGLGNNFSFPLNAISKPDISTKNNLIFKTKYFNKSFLEENEKEALLNLGIKNPLDLINYSSIQLNENLKNIFHLRIQDFLENKFLHLDIFSEHKQFSSLKNFLNEEEVSADLFSAKKWINEQSELPFSFYKKEHFNLFKSFEKRTIDLLIFNNENYSTLNNKEIKKISLFIYFLCYSKNSFLNLFFENGKLTTNLEKNNIFHYLIFLLYNAFSIKRELFLNININSFLEDDNILLFRNIFHTFMTSLMKDFSKNFSSLDELKKVNVELTSKLSYLFYYCSIIIYYISNDEKKYFSQQEITDFYNIKNVKSLNNIETEMKYFKTKYESIVFFNESTNSKIIHYKTTPFILNNQFILFPLIEKNDFQQESKFMDNCVRSKYYDYEKSLNFKYSNMCHIDLFFHVLDLTKCKEDMVKKILTIFKRDGNIMKHNYFINVSHYSLHIRTSFNVLFNIEKENNSISLKDIPEYKKLYYSLIEIKTKRNQSVNSKTQELLMNLINLS